MPLEAVHELPPARDDDIHLVARVRLLRIGPPRRVELDAEAAALERDREPLAGRTGQLAQQLGGGEPVAICGHEVHSMPRPAFSDKGVTCP